MYADVCVYTCIHMYITYIYIYMYRGISDSRGSRRSKVSAIGKPRFVQSDWIKPGAVVVNVGTTFTGDRVAVGALNFLGKP